MEEKLKQAASKLPQPTGDFLAVEEAYSHKQSRRSGVRKRHLAALLTVALLLAGFTTAFATAEVNHSAWVDPFVHGWGTVKRELKKLDYTLPKTLGESKFTQAEHMYFSPPGTKWAMAILKPSYKPTIVTYGTEVVKRSGVPQPVMKLMFGSTLNKYCHQWWILEEDYEPWFMRKENLLEGTGEKLEYEENILYTGTLVFDGGKQTTYDLEGNPIIEQLDDRYEHYVLWVDEERNIACCLESKKVNLENLLEYAKGIMDLNKPSA